MILIISEDFDQTTCQVIDWLKYNNKPFFRINTQDFSKISISLKNKESVFYLEKGGVFISEKDITKIWHRRGMINTAIMPNVEKTETAIIDNLRKTVMNESHTINNYIMKRLLKKDIIGNYFKQEINKLEVLEEARKVGLNIPETIISVNNSELLNFQTLHKKVITKPIYEVFHYTDKGKHGVSRTERIGKDELKLLNDLHMPILLQQEIDRKYELRIFFIKKEYYCLCMIPNNEKNASPDIRNELNSIRKIPFNLPAIIKSKLTKLNEKLSLHTGSIDMIYTYDNRYVFLEVNPVGQFGTLSNVGNFHIEKKIAEELSN